MSEGFSGFSELLTRGIYFKFMEQLFELLNLSKLLLNRNLILTYFVLEICVILLVLFILPLISSIFWIDLITNSIISFFCGVVELAVSFLFVFEFIRTKTFFSFFLFLSFYIPGISDIYASFVTDLKTFIWIRVINAFSSSIFFYLGCLLIDKRYSVNSNMFAKFLIFLAIFSSVGFGFIFRIVSPYLPEPFVFKNLENIEYEGLNEITIFISILSITLFLASTFLLYNKYKKYQKDILLAMSIYSIMMANINLLFTLSTLWNMVWWTWNVMRLLVYIFLFGLFLLGFIYLFSDLSRKTKELAVAYHQLKSTQERLVASERMAAAGIMAATIIHEIRTPIATINNLIQLISNMDIQSNYDTFLELKGLLSEEVHRIKRITEIFNLSNARYIPKKETVNLSEEIKSWIESFKQLYANLIARKRITIESEIEKDVYANIDKDGIKICLYNLIKNAVESTEEGIIKITLKKNDDKVELSVEDTGVGIPKEDLDKIFEPFYTSKGKGIGLGLFIVKRIVDAHDGWVEVESFLGKGSKFSIIIPAL